MSNLIEGENARHCTECNKLKHFNNFSPDKSGKYGYQSRCKSCRNRKQRNKREIDRLANIEIKWVDGELLMETLTAKVCPQCDVLKLHNKYYKKSSNPNGIESWCIKCCKKHYRENRERNLKRNKRWRENNSERMQKARDKWRKNNKEKYYNYQLQYQNKRYKNDINYKILRNLRNRTTDAVKNNRKSKTTKELLGISVQKFRKYIERQWEDGMSWENHGRGKGCWHIDHIIPCNRYNFSNEYEMEECFFYTNMQPLWAEENWRKQ